MVVFPESMWALIPMLRMCDSVLCYSSVTGFSDTWDTESDVDSVLQKPPDGGQISLTKAAAGKHPDCAAGACAIFHSVRCAVRARRARSGCIPAARPARSSALSGADSS